MMNNSQLAKLYLCLKEVDRFKKRAQALVDRVNAEDKLPTNERCYTYKEGGALRRASLDLSRALSELRK